MTGAVKLIPIGKRAQAITISAYGREVWGMPADNKLAVISTDNDEVAKTRGSPNRELSSV